MKNTVFLLFVLTALCITACQNQPSTLEEKRQELEEKRQELKEKQEIAAINEEMKNVEDELKKTKAGSKAQTTPAISQKGRIKGENVIMRAEPSTESTKMDSFRDGEPVQILNKTLVEGDNGSYWYQIRRSSQQVGWVFGKYLEEI